MKSCIVLTAAIVLATSCSSYYYVNTDVRPDLSVVREVYTHRAETGNDPLGMLPSSIWTVSKSDSVFTVDFHDNTESMNHVARAHGNIDRLSVTIDETCNLVPVETLDRRNRWFYTYYDYKAVFPSLRDSLPLPFEGYLTDSQLELFFRGSETPEGWNGLEMYNLLGDVNSKFMDWYSDAMYLTLREIFRPYCNDRQNAFLDTCKDDFSDGEDKEGMLLMRPEEFAERLDVIAPEQNIGDVYGAHEAEIDAAYDAGTRIFGYFENVFIYRTTLPGKLCSTDAASFVGGSPVWKADGYRLLSGDLVLTATSRRVNPWAFIVTFAAIAVFLAISARIVRK